MGIGGGPSGPRLLFSRGSDQDEAMRSRRNPNPKTCAAIKVATRAFSVERLKRRR